MVTKKLYATDVKALHADWIERGAKIPSDETLQKLKYKLQYVENEMENCLKRIERIRHDRHAAALDLVRAIGSKQPIVINGKAMIVTSRGGLLFYRPAGAIKGGI